jgi:hypothetical protein
MVLDLIFKKAKFLSINHKKCIRQPVYTINGEKLQRVESIKDLRIGAEYKCLSKYI